MGECRSKKFGCKLGALQMVFPEPAFLRQGGDTLTYLLDLSLPKLEKDLAPFLEGRIIGRGPNPSPEVVPIQVPRSWSRSRTCMHGSPCLTPRGGPATNGGMQDEKWMAAWLWPHCMPSK